MPSHAQVFGFWHVAAVNDWRQVAERQLGLLRASGLYDRSERVFVGILGRPEKTTLFRDRKIEVLFQEGDLQQYEFATLACLQRFCHNRTSRVYYFHTKGVFSGKSNPNVRSWRSYLEYFVLERPDLCLEALESADLCGVNWQLEPRPHFSGNFWWARSEYVRALPRMDSLDRSHRDLAEAWIGMHPQPRVAALHQSNVNHYLECYPPTAYRRIDFPDPASTTVTALTPVFLNCPERLEYLKSTLESFHRQSRFPGKIAHHVADDRSPHQVEELGDLCKQYGARIVHRSDPAYRRGFFEVFQALLKSVETEFYLYLEPDHYFYLEADFLTPILKAFAMLPELVGVYLRTPLVKERFRRDNCQLMTADGTRLSRFPIDAENTLWIGMGRGHEGFSLMPTVFRTMAMTDYALREGFWIDGDGPLEVETAIDADWNGTRLMGYLNAQAFCYHIGAVGGSTGGSTHVGDSEYERIWSPKIL